MTDITEGGLSVENNDAYYGRTQALFGVNLAVSPGERVALLGRNGAGKTTTLLSIMNVQVRATGQVRFDGRDISKARTTDISRTGIAWVPDTRRVFASMSVRENLMVAARRRSAAVIDEVVAEFPLLEPLLSRESGHLSGGEQQVLAIGRALATRPRVLLLDEPTEGLAPRIADELRESIVRLGGGDMSILLAEQSLSFALSFCSRAYIFDIGRVVFQGPSADVASSRDDWQRYIVAGGDLPVSTAMPSASTPEK
jgi:branched-chain amino acid transport system ATP-binding protein